MYTLLTYCPAIQVGVLPSRSAFLGAFAEQTSQVLSASLRLPKLLCILHLVSSQRLKPYASLLQAQHLARGEA